MKNHTPNAFLFKYTLPGDWEVSAGKTNIDNDILSLQIARPNDYWFHVKSMPGSHVVLHCHDRDETPSADIIKQVAAIAAYHSKARNGGITAVSQTLAKHVGKPRGSKPGSVTISKQKIIKVRPAIPTNSENS